MRRMPSACANFLPSSRGRLRNGWRRRCRVMTRIGNSTASATGRKKRQRAVCVILPAMTFCTWTRSLAGRRKAAVFCGFSPTSIRPSRASGSRLRRSRRCWKSTAKRPVCRGRTGMDWLEQLREGVVRLFRPGKMKRSVYDSFMLRFHDFLKRNEGFQERGPKRLWTFPPGSAWIAFTDTCSHSVLRGRYRPGTFLLRLPARPGPAGRIAGRAAEQGWRGTAGRAGGVIRALGAGVRRPLHRVAVH